MICAWINSADVTVLLRLNLQILLYSALYFFTEPHRVSSLPCPLQPAQDFNHVTTSSTSSPAVIAPSIIVVYPCDNTCWQIHGLPSTHCLRSSGHHSGFLVPRYSPFLGNEQHCTGNDQGPFKTCAVSIYVSYMTFRFKLLACLSLGTCVTALLCFTLPGTIYFHLKLATNC